jgi:hypothetical protein
MRERDNVTSHESDVEQIIPGRCLQQCDNFRKGHVIDATRSTDKTTHSTYENGGKSVSQGHTHTNTRTRKHTH